MVIVVSKPGRLGNRLRVGAMLVAFSAEHGLPTANLAFDEYAAFFEGPARDLLCRYPPKFSRSAQCARLRRVLYGAASRAAALMARFDRWGLLGGVIRLDWHEICDMSSPEFMQIARLKRVVLLQGWHFTDHSALRTHADVVRAFFAPREPHRSAALAVAAAARADSEAVVGIHIRRGDYRWMHNGKFLYDLTDYEAAMTQITHLLGARVGFVICSDEPYDIAQFAGHPVYAGPGDSVADLYTLASCDYLIGAPSTYTAWASFYGDTPVYYGPPRADFSLAEFRVIDDLWPPATAEHARYELGGTTLTPWRSPFAYKERSQNAARGRVKPPGRWLGRG
jgi:hypothetical protein